MRIIICKLLLLFVPSLHSSAQSDQFRVGLPLGHNASVNSAVFSSDERFILTASDDNTAMLWDAKTGKLILTLKGHTNRVVSAAFSPDDSKILTTSEDNTARLWDTQSGQLIYTMEGDPWRYQPAMFSPDGSKILTDSSNPTVLVWDTHTGQEILKLEGHRTQVNSAVFSPDGSKILTASWDKTAIVWDIKTGKRIHTLKGHKAPLYLAIFNPDGSKILTASDDKTARLWDAKTGRLIYTLDGHTSGVNSVIFSPEGSKILTTDFEGIVRLWDTKTGNLLHTFESAFALFSPDGSKILTAFAVVWLWDTETGELINNWQLNGYPNSLVFNHDGTKLLTSVKNSAYLFNARTGLLTHTLKGHQVQFFGAGFSPNNSRIATISSDNITRLWDLKTGQPIDLDGHINNVTSAEFSSEGSKILTTSWDNTARLWDAWTGELIHELGFNGNVLSGIFSSNDSIILTVSVERITHAWVAMWDSNTGKLIRTLKSNIQQVNSAIFNSDDSKILTSSCDKTACIWNTQTGQLIHTLKGHTSAVISAVFSPDDSKVLTVSADHTARLWDSQTGQLIHTLEGHQDIIKNAVFSSDGTKILTASYDHTARLWDSQTGQLIHTLESHTRGAVSAAFSPDDSNILTSSWGDNNAFVWDAQTGQLLYTLEGNTGSLNYAEYSSDGTKIITSSDGSCIIWNAKTGQQVVQLFVIDGKNQLWLLPNGYYYASKEAATELHYIKGLQVVGFEQLDLKYNRPDLVLERLGFADSSLIAAYHQAYLKRLKKMEFTEEMLQDDFHLPEIKIENFEQLPLNNDDGSIDLKLKLHDSKYLLDRINVWVNDVAVYGKNGISLRDKKVREYSTTLSVSLARGENKIQVSVLNQAGVESYKETIEVNCTYGKDKSDLFLLSVGVSNYKDTRYNLSYASKDANDLVTAFMTNNYFEKIYSKTLTDNLVTLENLTSLKSFFANADINDQVIVFVAGHGVLDENFDYYFASYDMDFSNPAARGIPYEMIEALLDGIKPLRKLLFMDTCHSGEVEKDEIQVANSTATSENDIVFRTVGVAVENKELQLGLHNTSELMKILFTDLRKGIGATVISSAGGVEFAMESDQWKNGLFTYCLINGLTSKDADLNNDKMIMVSEIQTYVQTEVTKLSGGKQTPTSRVENLELDYRIW